MKPKAKKKTGRPVIPIDWNLVNQLLEAGCSGVGIAEQIGISEDTLYLRVQQVYKQSFTAYASLHKKPKIRIKKDFEKNFCRGEIVYTSTLSQRPRYLHLFNLEQFDCQISLMSSGVRTEPRTVSKLNCYFETV